MVKMTDKKVRESVQRHVISHYKGNGGKTGLVDEIKYLMRQGYGTPYRVGLLLAEGGTFLVYTADIKKFLHRIGFKDSTLENYRGKYKGDIDTMYFRLCATACEEIYKESVKKNKSRGY